jgi:hypothetical protein
MCPNEAARAVVLPLRGDLLVKLEKDTGAERYVDSVGDRRAGEYESYANGEDLGGPMMAVFQCCLPLVVMNEIGKIKLTLNP